MHTLVGFILMILVPFISQAAESPLVLRDNLRKAVAGDFIVTAQNKNYTILVVRSKDTESISIEEITVPSAMVTINPTFSWRRWVEGGAKGNTCWLLYHIQLGSGTIQQTYSFSKHEWVTIPQSQNFLSTLLNLQLLPVLDKDRKKVGPRPSGDTVDRREVWQPQLVVDGKVVKGVSFDSWRTKWPKDGSELSGKVIEIYLPKDSGKYPAYFPYWLQISGFIGKAKVRIVDSGSGLISPART